MTDKKEPVPDNPKTGEDDHRLLTALFIASAGTIAGTVTIANILREENGGDLTYFIEYFLDLLSRAIDERKLRAQREEESLHESESELARIPLIPSGEPQHEAVEYPEESAETNEPTDIEPIEITDIETLYTPGVPIDYTPTQIIDDEVGSLRLRDELLTLAENSSSRRQSCARLLLSFLDKGIDSFTVEDISSGCGITLDQAGNLVNSLKDKGLIESCDRRVGKMMVYRFGRDLPPLKPDDYSKEILRTISKLLNSHKSAKDRRIGELIFLPAHQC